MFPVCLFKAFEMLSNTFLTTKSELLLQSDLHGHLLNVTILVLIY